MGLFCSHCEKDRAHREDPKMMAAGCDIILHVMAFDIDDPKYPKEWVQDERGPRCTAFEEEKR